MCWKPVPICYMLVEDINAFHVYVYIGYIYIYMCVCVCVCVLQ